jgi:hypothetical protein
MDRTANSQQLRIVVYWQLQPMQEDRPLRRWELLRLRKLKPVEH